MKQPDRSTNQRNFSSFLSNPLLSPHPPSLRLLSPVCTVCTHRGRKSAGQWTARREKKQKQLLVFFQTHSRIITSKQTSPLIKAAHSLIRTVEENQHTADSTLELKCTQGDLLALPWCVLRAGGGQPAGTFFLFVRVFKELHLSASP